MNADSLEYPGLFVSCLTVLVLIGVDDESFDISYKLRMGIQAILTLVMVHLRA